MKSDARFRAGWARALLRDGVYTFTDAQRKPVELDLGIGSWSRNNNEIITSQDFRADHNDHIHVALSEAARQR
ncbi:hypothetical protein ABGB18_38565 [Nonomuraea sp. B12E4]|uniref:hypothetical protein n=1 Tax=Nonomuraea sp. B12E4 TaxID=3153564 RepID=UPI00325D81E2